MRFLTVYAADLRRLARVLQEGSATLLEGIVEATRVAIDADLAVEPALRRAPGRR